ncbi:MAG: tyrosine-type recombinase/integrase family protein, partial [Oscillospiraceae bacterium]|nr:tyrosine-type recombinase/integrase family protein [Oscillospiraceae bacterium]
MSKKGENIYKRKDNRWEARYIRFYHPDGSPKYGYCYGKTYREAREKAAQAKALLYTGTPAPVNIPRRLFGTCCDEWLQVNRSRVKESTYVKYSTILEKHIKPRLGGFRLQALNTVTVEQFGHDLLYENALSPKTVKDILTVLHSVIKYIAKQTPTVLPPLEIIYPKVPKSETRVLSREEQTLFVQNLLRDMDPYKFGILLALLTGMRIGEVCALRWGN